jgi:hypothetical protein
MISDPPVPPTPNLAAVKAEIRLEIDDLTGLLQRAANSLLIAHGAALLGCLSQLKDYTPDSKLKGIGIFIVSFACGFIVAALAYIDTALGRAKMLVGLFKNDVAAFQPKELRRASTLLYVSIGVLLLTILGIAWKFIWL